MKYLLLILLLLMPLASADIMLFYEGEEEYSYDETGIYIGDYRYVFFDYEGTLNVNITNSNVIIYGSRDTVVGFHISKGRTNYNLVSLGEIYEGEIQVTTTPKTYSLVVSNVVGNQLKQTPWYMKNFVAFEYDRTTLSDGSISSKVFEVPIIYVIAFLLSVTMLWYFLR